MWNQKLKSIEKKYKQKTIDSENNTVQVTVHTEMKSLGWEGFVKKVGLRLGMNKRRRYK